MNESKTITEQFPPLPLEYITTTIRFFDKLSLKEKRDFITEVVKVHPFLNLNFSSNKIFRRARRISEDYFADRVQDLLWRENVPASPGRANPEGYSVLYVADRPETALMETGSQDDFVLISELKIRKDLNCRVMPIGELMRLQRAGRGMLTGDVSAEILKIINACNPDEMKSVLIADAFLFECLIKDDDNYLVSSFVAKSIFAKNNNIAAVVYPSVKQYGAVNFAIRTENFWDAWSIVGARRLHAKHLAYGYYDLSQAQHVTEITSEGKLVWGHEITEGNVGMVLDPPWHPLRKD